MSFLSDFPRSDITVFSPDGESRGTLSAVITRDLAIIDEPKAVINTGDELRRRLPNGQDEVFEVIDPTFYEGIDDLGPHFQVKISRKGVFTPRSGGSYSVHVTGSNSRVNIGSHDASTNTVISGSTFTQLKEALARQLEDRAERDKMLALVEKLEAEKGRPGFALAYQQFVANAANHMTIIAPFLPLLAPLFSS